MIPQPQTFIEIGLRNCNQLIYLEKYIYIYICSNMWDIFIRTPQESKSMNFASE